PAGSHDYQVCVPASAGTQHLPRREDGIESFAAVAKRSHERDTRPIDAPSEGGPRPKPFILGRRAEPVRVDPIVDAMNTRLGYPQAADYVSPRPLGIS